MGAFDGLSGEDLRQAEKSWVMANSSLVRTGMNDARNYTQSQLRNRAQKLVGEGKYLPTAEELLVCAMRGDIEKNDKTRWIFDLYWDEFLFCVLGKANWDVRFRHHGLISTTFDPTLTWGGDEERRISIGTEAFLVLLFENCRAKWKYMAKFKKEGRKYDKKHRRMETPYTDADVGVAKFGGWNDAGRARYKELGDMIFEAQTSNPEHVAVVEKACLKRLRSKHSVDQKGKKTAKRARVEEEEEEEDAAWN
jgi:hypothetical protein